MMARYSVSMYESHTHTHKHASACAHVIINAKFYKFYSHLKKLIRKYKDAVSPREITLKHNFFKVKKNFPNFNFEIHIQLVKKLSNTVTRKTNTKRTL